MSKHREALRRGIRSLIHDTSRELADLEGREAPAEGAVRDAPDAPDRGPQPFDGTPAAATASLVDADVVAVEVRDISARAPAAPASELEPPAAVEKATLGEEVPAVDEAPSVDDVRAVEPRRVPEPSPASAVDGAPSPLAADRADEGPSDTPYNATAAGEVARASEDAVAEASTAPETASAARPDERPSEVPPGAGPPSAGEVARASDDAVAEASTAPETAGAGRPDDQPSEVPADAGPLSSAGPAPASEQFVAEGVIAAAAVRATAARRPRKRRTRKGAKKGAKTHRGAASVPGADPIDGVDPAQAHTRKGVCVAYFVDHACWHVTNAYCNTALHVCVRRDCPVYHLHQAALERRFASKYRHFW